MAHIELESLDHFDAHFRAHQSFLGTASQGLDLTERTEVIIGAGVEGAFFLGCTLAPAAKEYLDTAGALVFPGFPNLPFRAFRPRLYDAFELYARYEPGKFETYHDTMDGATYEWHKNTLSTKDVIGHLAERIHDHSIDDALDTVLGQVGEDQVVAIMGGHAMRRDEEPYKRVAELGRALCRAGWYVATGGGPGAMEAANLGAWFAPFADSDLDEAIAMLAPAPTYEDTGPWLDTAIAVRERWERGDASLVSLGVPTWHYGHEPPNVFPTEIAKYFANSIREEGLLAIALGGVIYAPGSAGTIQEVFQDAAQNHYKSFGVASPMIFADVKFWTETKPVLPLLAQLADGHEYGTMIGAYDDPDEAVAHLNRVRDQRRN